MRLIKLHLGLLNFIRKEIKKKRTLKQWIIFSRNVLFAYGKALIEEYKNLFLLLNPEYLQQRKQFNKVNKLKQDLQRALRMLQYIDDKMEKQGINRQRRRQFWRDFFSQGQVRKEIFEQLMKELK